MLESIVGDDFLPKSEELATRLPIFLKLKRERYYDDDFESYALVKYVRDNRVKRNYI